MKMMTRSEIDEMISIAGDQVVENVMHQMEEQKEGFDPRDILMNGALNVITSFLISETYAFNDPEQVMIFNFTTTLLKGLLDLAVLLIWSRMFPDFMIRKGWHKSILEWIKPKSYDIYNVLFGQAFPFWMKKIKQHQLTLDVDAPRDFLDTLLIQAKLNNEIGYHSVIMTTMALYVAGADSTSNTLRWILSILAEHQDVQEKFYQDIKQCKSKMGKPTSSECHYVNAVIEEVFRFRPITESVMHGTVCDINVEGHFIPAGTMVQANFTSVHFNPKYFTNPESFNPDRFISDGIFKVN